MSILKVTEGVLPVLLYKLVSVCINLSQSPDNFTEKLKFKVVFKI